MLYSKDKSKLLNYPSGRRNTFYKSPSYVKEIAPYSFSGCNNLKSVSLPYCTKISRGLHCKKLKELYLPKSLVKLSLELFTNCDFIFDIYFAGFEKQWNNILDKTAGNYYKKYNVHFSDSIGIKYKITKNLHNVISSTSISLVSKNSSYSMKLVPTFVNVFTKVLVKMNSKVPNASYTTSSRYINIPKVIGNISILAYAKKSQSISAKSYIKTLNCKSFYLNAKAKTKLSYYSSNKKVATVSSKGKVSIKGAGKATLTIYASSSNKYASVYKKVNLVIYKS